MKIYSCGVCGNAVHFHNRACVNCGHRLGFRPEQQTLFALKPQGGDLWQLVSDDPKRVRFCANAATDICNWVVDAEDGSEYCFACRFNRLVPNDLDRWRRINEAEKELFYSFLKWNLPCPDRKSDPIGGLVFDFLEDEKEPDGTVKHAITGHDEGVIAIRAAEADDVVRETLRSQLHEAYRTMLGHFRHECGHFIWDKMIRDAGLMEECRTVFGDERLDYSEACKRHYENGPPDGWQDSFISAYATMHPWEDFAESFAHCLHIVDALETAHAFGMALKSPNHKEIAAEINFEPYKVLDFERLAEVWIPLSVAVNSIHASMGERPLYPFILTPTVKAKLGFILKIITRQPVGAVPEDLIPA